MKFAIAQKWFATVFIAVAAVLQLVSCTHADDITITETAQTNFVELASHAKLRGLSGIALLNAAREIRISVAKQLKEAVVSHYSLIELKNRRILADDGQPFNSIAHLDGCITTEENTLDNSDLHFIDRMKLCIAAFQDTHFGAYARMPLPNVSVGFLIRKIEGHYVIVARQGDLLDYTKTVSGLTNLDEVTAVGNEVLEVDGVAPAVLADHYKKYINSSSPGHRQLSADVAILSRNYDYPTKSTVHLKIKSRTKTYDYELPWWAATGARSRLDTSEYFQKIGIPVNDRVRMFLDPDGKVDWKTVPLNYSGYLDSNPLVKSDPFRPIVTFKGDSGAIAARMGTIVTPKQSFCYLQLLTFSTEEMVAPDGTSLPYIETVRRFVKSCKAADLDMVVDLRSNGGGNGSYVAQVLSLLTPHGSTLGNKVMAFRVNSTAARLISSMIEHPEIAAKDLGNIDHRFLSEIQNASDAGLSMTNTIPERAGTVADADVGGYEGKVVVLVTPNCVSACDGMAAILKRTGRAVVLGTHSNGTGAGFQGTTNLDSNFTDTYDELSLKIPNYQFGYSAKPFPDLISVPYEATVDDYFTENMPTVADVIVEPTLGDVLGLKNTWLDATLKALSTP